MRVELKRVDYMPRVLEPGILYVAEEFGAAAHLCACGCGAKIRTPLGPTEWWLEETKDGPSLYPSVGNWQQKCKTHYLIRRGEVIWANKWSPEEILEGRREEEERRKAYFDERSRQREGVFKRFVHWFFELFRS